jgi:hypothetical protein
MKGLGASAIVLALIAGAGAWYFWPNQERRVRARLSELASAASAPAGESEVGRAARLAALTRSLTEDASFAGAPGLPAITGREALAGLASHAATILAPYEISVVGVEITLDGIYATASMTIRVTGLDDAAVQRRFDGQELRLELVEQDNEWRVRRIEPLSALTPTS